MKIVTIDTGKRSRNVHIAASLAKEFQCECVLINNLYETVSCMGHDVIVVCPTERCESSVEEFMYSMVVLSDRLIALQPDDTVLTPVIQSVLLSSQIVIAESDLGSMNFHNFHNINVPISLTRQKDTSLSFGCSLSELYQSLLFDEIKGDHALVTHKSHDESSFVRFAKEKVGSIIIINQYYYDVKQSEMIRNYEKSFVIRDYSKESYFNVDPCHLHALSLGLKLVWPKSVLDQANDTIVQIASHLNKMDYIDQLEWFDTFFSSKRYASMLKGVIL